jgi:hypothetical protein
MMLDTISIAFATIGYIYAGVWSNHWYQKRLDELEEKLIEDRGEEFNDWGRVLWGILMVTAWPLVLLKESITDFRQWKYPYCSAEAMRNIRSAKLAKRQ